MPDRTATPEELLDQWLDALNEPGHRTPPHAPEEIGEVAAIALRYRAILGVTPDVMSVRRTRPERNAAVSHPLPLTSPNGRTWTVAPPPERRAGWVGGLSSWLATAVIVGLLIALVGGAFVRLNGLPGDSGDPARVPGIAASPASSVDGALSCSSLDYRPVVEGEVNEETLAAIGETEAPLRFDGAHIHVPTSDGEIVTLANTWTPLGGPMWSNQAPANATGDATVRNVDTGEEWTYPDTTHSLNGLYLPPYLIVPATGRADDFRIIDTETGEEVLTSELRGEPFPVHVRATQIAADYASGSYRPPAVLLFSSDEAVRDADPEIGKPDTGPNALYLPRDLDGAHFLDDAVHADYVHETTYSVETNRLAYATEVVGEPAIVVIRLGTDDRLEIRHPEFTADSLPLMFSEDGTMLVVSRPGALVTFDLRRGPQSVPLTHTSDEPFMPIAHNAASRNVLVQYPDGHVAIVNAGTGEVTDFPEVTVPASDLVPTEPDRLSFETDVYELFDDEAGAVRFVNLVTGTVSPETAVLNPEEEWISASFQPQTVYRVTYPHANWPGGHAWLDASAALQVVPTEPGGREWSAPAPEGFALGEAEVARLFTNPDGTCIVLEVATAEEFGAGSTTRSERVATWIMPLEPGAEWTRLDTHLTGWFPIVEEDATETLPAQDFATPTTTPSIFEPNLQTRSGPTVNLKAEPASGADIVTALPPETPLMAVEAPGSPGTPVIETDAEDQRWLRVTTADGDVGWIREIDLKPYP